jgi:large subunit ribosomal protein L3
MPTTRKPRAGTLQFKPEKRAKRETPRIRYWNSVPETKLLGFPGYKVGMTHIIIVDNKNNSKTKGEELFVPVTIIECPPIKIASVVFYKNTPYGLKTVSAVQSMKLDKTVERTIPMPKAVKHKIEDMKSEDFDDLRIQVYTQPKLTTIGKKKPALLELALGGKKEEKINWVKENFDKEIDVSNVLRAGQLIDTHAVTKGKGLQGPMKRDGIHRKHHKSEKGVRKGVLAAEGVAKVSYRAHQSGQMGYHLRMEHNKWIVKLSNDPKEVNLNGGFVRYGIVKNSYVLVKGSVGGARKRLVVLTNAIRPDYKIPKEAPVINYIKTVN